MMIYSKLLAKLAKFCVSKETNCGGARQKVYKENVCYERDVNTWPNLDDFLHSFPNFTFTLDSNQEYTLTGVEYLFLQRSGKENYCLGFYELG